MVVLFSLHLRFKEWSSPIEARLLILFWSGWLTLLHSVHGCNRSYSSSSSFLLEKKCFEIMFWRRASEADRGQRVRLCWMTWYSDPRGHERLRSLGSWPNCVHRPVSVLSLVLRVSCTGTVLSWFPQQVWTCLTMKPGAIGSPLVSSGSETSYWQNWIRINVLYPPGGN